MSNAELRPSSPPSRLAIYLSALVYPGAGQFAQKRWLAGSFYAVAFSVCFVFLLFVIFIPMLWNLRCVMEFADTGRGEAFHKISFAKLLAWSGISLLVYIAGLADTFVFYRRAHTRRPEAGSQDKNIDNHRG